MKPVCSALALLILLAMVGCVLGASAQGGDAMQSVRELARPYYEAAIPIAQASPELGRNFTDHKTVNSRANWLDCFLRLDSAVAAWNADHPDAPIEFDGSFLSGDDERLGMLASVTLALRVGDVSRDSGPDAEVQTGETVHVERETLNDRGGSIDAEIEGASITVGEKHEDVVNQQSRQVHAGEQNIPENHTYADGDGVVTHEITVTDGCSAPRCTQQAVDDHLGEFYSARDGRFVVRLVFLSFEDGEDGFFRDSWEDFRLQAAQDYPNIEIRYPWDEEAHQ